jgi:phenylalanyl-tRNA synthetase alpha subunit
MERDFNPADCDTVLVSDPSQGSDIERVNRAQAILEEAKAQPQQILNLRLAYLEWLKAMKTPNIEELAPEPDPNAQDPQQQIMIAQMQMEAELKKTDQELRASAQELQKQKMAMEAAKSMSEIGLKADKQEAETTNLYTQSLERIVKAGIASGMQAVEVVAQIEDRFIEGEVINAEGGIDGREEAGSQQGIAAPTGPMVNQPSDQGLS